MLRTYLLVRDHLEQARAILSVDDPSSGQLSKTLQVMITLIDEMQPKKCPRRAATNIIVFPGADPVLPREN